MNKYEHADHSATLFGGDPSEYEAFHGSIDANKVVTPSIFGRFFLHHMDVGLPILEKLFGERIGTKKVPAKKLLAQHLIEDYGQVLTFKKHWMPALKMNAASLPTPDVWESFLQKASGDRRLAKLDKAPLEELENFFQLKTILKDSTSIQKVLAFAIFGHALGGDVAASILGKKFHGLWTSDVVTGYLNCRFRWADRSRDPVPTLLDYEKNVPDEAWMHSPNSGSDTPFKPKQIKKLIEEYEKNEEIEIKKSTIHRYDFLSRRQPCNLD